MYKYSFEKLVVWKESMELVTFVYNITKKFPSDERFGLISQLRRASISVSSNIAEGTSRTTNKDKSRFTTIAYSSLMEVLCQIIIAEKLQFIMDDEYIIIREKINTVANLLNSLKKAQLK